VETRPLPKVKKVTATANRHVLTQHPRFKDGKEHRYWSMVEHRRCAGGKVVQRPVLDLGEPEAKPEINCRRQPEG
jgi:hypothetical protein